MQEVIVPIVVAIVTAATPPLVQAWRDALKEKKRKRARRRPAGSASPVLPLDPSRPSASSTPALTKSFLRGPRVAVFLLVVGVGTFFAYRFVRHRVFNVPTWVRLTDHTGRAVPLTRTYMTPNADGRNPRTALPVHFEFSAPEKQRFISGEEIIDVRDGANAGSAAFSDCRRNAPGHPPSTGQIHVSPDGKTISINYRQWGKPFELTFGANLEEFR